MNFSTWQILQPSARISFPPGILIGKVWHQPHFVCTERHFPVNSAMIGLQIRSPKLIGNSHHFLPTKLPSKKYPAHNTRPTL
ncbi:hypothetical protein [Calothrix sp. 336/3]|uniref:hypothetical protein n=1 Tax=Calothrix sp. 336/3 TaxID=1337936 RepID=UPI0004E3F215|nr:hypothetical protein [Calothrix sp. 336/3]AKG24011.1 hypothetical protein IJ00_24280 [Calothrix sp. 336/3]